MLADSDLERRTLVQLLRLQEWLGQRRGVALTIEKRLFDIGHSTGPGAAGPAPAGGPESAAEEDADVQAFLERAGAAIRAMAASLRHLGIKHRPEGDEDAREPCLPGFLLWVRPVPAGGRQAVVVEAMGYADAPYRERDARTC